MKPFEALLVALQNHSDFNPSIMRGRVIALVVELENDVTITSVKEDEIFTFSEETEKATEILAGLLETTKNK